MKSKFESIVQEEMQKIENPTLEEGFWGAVRTAAANTGDAVRTVAANTAKNVMYGDQQGRMETKDDYASRMGWGGDQHKEYSIKGYNNYKPGNKPVIIDWKKNYKGFFAKLANDARTEKVQGSKLKPTIKTFINGIDFDQPPNNQQGFFAICAEKFGSRTSNQYRSRLPTRREAKEYDVDGVRYRMANVDFKTTKETCNNSDTIYGNSYFFTTFATDYEQITEWDKQIYVNDVVAILRPYMDKLINGVNEIKKLINAQTEGNNKDNQKEQVIPDGPERIGGTPEDAKREQYMNVFRVADPSGGEKTSNFEDVDYPLIEAIVDRLSTRPEIIGSLLTDLNSVKTLLNSDKINYTALPTKLNTILGVPYYPNVSNDMLATYFFQGMEDNFVQLGYSNIKNDLFFLPPDEINKIRNEFRGKWDLMHPIQTYDNLKSKFNDFSNRLGMWSGKNIATNNMQ